MSRQQTFAEGSGALWRHIRFSITSYSKSSTGTRLLFAENLRQAREKKGSSQEALADLARLHRTYVGSVERGERNISIDNIAWLARREVRIRSFRRGPWEHELLKNMTMAASSSEVGRTALWQLFDGKQAFIDATQGGRS